MTRLDPDNPSAAYQCGRALAAVDSIQYAALGAINTTVGDRYFGAASSRPATVLPSLIRGAQPHLSKIRKDNAGRAVNLEKQLGQIFGSVDEIPSVLSATQQAEFLLGYYHQRQHNFAGASAGGEVRTDQSEDLS